MSHEQLQKYIDQLNGGLNEAAIYKRQISDRVDVAKVYPEKMRRDSKVSPYTIFFIRNESKEYVGAVLDMHIDLHWYIAEKHRGNMYLTTALQEAILPHIFNKFGREKQEITIEGDFYEQSRSVAIKLGFKQEGESGKLKLLKENFDLSADRRKEIDLEINLERIAVLCNKISLAHSELREISDELLMSYDYDANLSEIAECTNDCSYNVSEELKFRSENPKHKSNLG
jgi:hypothetical protein